MIGSQVYLVGAGPFIKVGLSKDVTSRMRHWSVGCPYPTEIVWLSIRMERIHAESLERKIQDKLKDYWVKGEWFRVKDHIAIKVAKKIEAPYDLNSGYYDIPKVEREALS